MTELGDNYYLSTMINRHLMEILILFVVCLTVNPAFPNALRKTNSSKQKPRPSWKEAGKWRLFTRYLCAHPAIASL